ncbi:MAG: hypothetical protein IT198_14200 [Acidimicrobiia bacterium]|nr:hypothetical protein [Acidimicrobiia bacterium]
MQDDGPGSSEANHGTDSLNDPLVADAFRDPNAGTSSLVRACAAGSRHAFAILVRRYEPAAVVWARRALESQESADLLVQELFRRAWLRAAAAPANISRWLLEIGFEIAAEMGAPEAASNRDLDALWIGGVVREAMGHLPLQVRESLLDPGSEAARGAGVTLLEAMEELQELLQARGIVRRGDS